MGVSVRPFLSSLNLRYHAVVLFPGGSLVRFHEILSVRTLKTRICTKGTFFCYDGRQVDLSFQCYGLPSPPRIKLGLITMPLVNGGVDQSKIVDQFGFRSCFSPCSLLFALSM